MGNWSTKIDSNDTFQEVYQNFFDLYDEGENPDHIYKQIFAKFPHLSNDNNDNYHNTLFGLALAQWETQSLNDTVFKQVKEIIESGKNLELWKEANDKVIEKRKAALHRFLAQLSQPRERPKRKKKLRTKCNEIQLLELPAPNSNKILSIVETYIDGVFKYTRCELKWKLSSSTIFCFYQKEKHVTARWIDSEILEVTHDKTIVFAKKQRTFCRGNDQGTIKYIPVD
jgi:hypothetical protein